MKLTDTERSVLLSIACGQNDPAAHDARTVRRLIDKGAVMRTAWGLDTTGEADDFIQALEEQQ